MSVLAALAGIILVVAVLADMINTLVTTNTSNRRFWISQIIGLRSWQIIRWTAVRARSDAARNRLLAVYAPTLVLLLLIAWVTLQIIGFGLIWWGLGGVDGAEGLLDSLYFSGVVFFTVGFGEVVPADTLPRFGALIEAFAGVLTTALVIGYLPALYAAFSERERKLMTLDDGSEERITPTNLVMAWAPTGDAEDLVAHFDDWEDWVAGILETHTTFPMLRFFRSHHEGQSWITALGLLCDAALHCQLIRGAENRAPYFMLRRAVRLMHELTDGVDLSEYRARLDAGYGVDDSLFQGLYDALEDHGFELYPYEQASAASRGLRQSFDAQLEWLIDQSLAPRGFWGHTIGLRLESAADVLARTEQPPG